MQASALARLPRWLGDVIDLEEAARRCRLIAREHRFRAEADRRATAPRALRLG